MKARAGLARRSPEVLADGLLEWSRGEAGVDAQAAALVLAEAVVKWLGQR